LKQQISGIHAARTSRPRPDYLRVVPDPDSHTPATPCPAWCTVGEFHSDGDRFHYGEQVYVGDEQAVSVEPLIEEDGSRVVVINTDSIERNRLPLDEIDELIAALTAVRAILAGTQVAA